MNDDFEVLEGKIKATTDLAILLETPDGGEIWIPRSCCEDGSLDIDDEDPEVAEWWLRKEGLK